MNEQIHRKSINDTDGQVCEGLLLPPAHYWSQARLQDHIGSSRLIFPVKALSLWFCLFLEGKGAGWDVTTESISLGIYNIFVAMKDPQAFLWNILLHFYRGEVGCSLNPIGTGMG